MGSAAQAAPSSARQTPTSPSPLFSEIIMLSRLAVRSAMVPRCLAGARELATTPALAERDLVNFPPRQRPIERGPVKALIFPAEWFDALYPKTGVTGPYMALFGVSTFLASKEYFVMEHDFYVGGYHRCQGGDSKCAETHGAEAHGGLDHRQREGLHHPGPGGGSTEEMHF